MVKLIKKIFSYLTNDWKISDYVENRDKPTSEYEKLEFNCSGKRNELHKNFSNEVKKRNS